MCPREFRDCLLDRNAASASVASFGSHRQLKYPHFTTSEFLIADIMCLPTGSHYAENVWRVPTGRKLEETQPGRSAGQTHRSGTRSSLSIDQTSGRARFS